MALITLIPVSELAISLLNLIITSQVPPRQLPKLEMRGGIPARDRTMVVVPAIVDSPERLGSLLDDLEVRFFANRDPTPALRAAERLRRQRATVTARRRGPRRGRDAPGRRAQRAARRRSVLPVSPRSGAGIPASGAGWDGSANAASWRSSTGCFAATRAPASSCATATCRFCRRSATSSRSIPTPSCRFRPPAAWSGRCRIR